MSLFPQDSLTSARSVEALFPRVADATAVGNVVLEACDKMFAELCAQVPDAENYRDLIVNV